MSWHLARSCSVLIRVLTGSAALRHFTFTRGAASTTSRSALSSCFGLRAAVVTSLVDNEVGHLIDGLMRSSGVDVSWRRWLPFDGVGRAARNPLNFTERGFGVRSPLGVSDRGHSATSLLQPGEIDWEHLFGELGVRCLHTGGIFTALSVSTAAVAEEAMAVAHKYGTKVSYDLNYRPSLWQEAGGSRAAAELNERLLPMVDILIGVQAPPLSAGQDPVDPREVIAELVERHPEIACIAVTRRVAHSASRNDWSALGWSRARALRKPASAVSWRSWTGWAAGTASQQAFFTACSKASNSPLP